MKIYQHKVTKHVEWLGKELSGSDICNENYTSDITLFNVIHWSHYTFDLVQDMLKRNKSTTVSGFNKINQ